MVVGGVFFFAVPSLEQRLSELGEDLPSFTRAVLRFARWFRDERGWLMLLPVPIVLPIAITRFFGPDVQQTRARRSGGFGLLHVTAFVLLIFAVLMLASLVMPMMTFVPGAGAGQKP